MIAAPRAHVLMSQFICACRPSKNQVRPSLSFHSLGHLLWTRITLVCTCDDVMYRSRHAVVAPSAGRTRTLPRRRRRRRLNSILISVTVKVGRVSVFVS